MAPRSPKPGRSLADLHPELIGEWHPTKNGSLTPRDVSAGSPHVAWWIKACNPDEPEHVWDARISHRSDGAGCSVCKGFTLQTGVNDLASKFPSVAAEWHPTKNLPDTPSSIHSGSSKKAWWKCSTCEHEWEATVNSRTLQGTGCPECGRRRTGAARKAPQPGKSLSDLHPQVVKQWHPTKNAPHAATDFKPGSDFMAWWLCDVCGHEWASPIIGRVKRFPKGCRNCQRLDLGRRRRTPGKGESVADLYDHLVAEWHPLLNGTLKPQHVKPKSKRKIWWLCQKGHVWRRDVEGRTRGRGCPYCANYWVLIGFNDLLTTDPDLAREWHPTKNALLPIEVTRGNDTKVWWLGDCGHEWEATINSRTPTEGTTGSGCSICASSGFDRSKEAWLYLLQHPVYAMLQIGISNNPTERLAKHARRGWEVLEIRGPMTGDLAEDLERQALVTLQSRHADLGNAHIAGNFDGFTEAWTAASLQLESLSQLLNWIYEDEGP